MVEINKQNKEFESSTPEINNLIFSLKNFQGENKHIEIKTKSIISLTKIKTIKGLEKHFKDTMEFMRPKVVNPKDLKEICDTIAIYERLGCDVDKSKYYEVVDDMREITMVEDKYPHLHHGEGP